MRNDPLAPPRSARITMPLVLAVVTGATFLSAGSVALTRDTGEPALVSRKPVAAAKPVPIEERIPRNVVAFARVTVNPEGEERAALVQLLRRLPAEARSQALSAIDRELASELPGKVDLGKARAALGRHLALAVIVVNNKPETVTIFETKDHAAAASYIRASLRRGQVFVADGDVAYAGPRRAIASLRASAARNSMATHAVYLRELGALGGSGLAVGWYDGSRLAGVPYRNLPEHVRPQAGPTGEKLDFRAARMVGVVYAQGSSVIAELRGTGDMDPWMIYGGASRMRLFGNLPSVSTLAIGMSEPAKYVRLAAAGFLAGGQGSSMGVDLERDLYPWLGDEIAFAAVGKSGGGVAIGVKDEAAFDRAFAKVEPMLRMSGGYSGDERGFTMTSGPRTVVMRRTPGVVAISMAEGVEAASQLATQLITGGSGSLAADRSTRNLFSDDPASVRMLFRPDGAFPFRRGSDADTWLKHITAVAVETTVEGEMSSSRIVVSFA